MFPGRTGSRNGDLVTASDGDVGGWRGLTFFVSWGEWRYGVGVGDEMTRGGNAGERREEKWRREEKISGIQLERRGRRVRNNAAENRYW